MEKTTQNFLQTDLLHCQYFDMVTWKHFMYQQTAEKKFPPTTKEHKGGHFLKHLVSNSSPTVQNNNS